MSDRNTTAQEINAVLDRIKTAAPQLRRHQVRTLTGKLAAINTQLEEHEQARASKHTTDVVGQPDKIHLHDLPDEQEPA